MFAEIEDALSSATQMKLSPIEAEKLYSVLLNPKKVDIFAKSNHRLYGTRRL